MIRNYIIKIKEDGGYFGIDNCIGRELIACCLTDEIGLVRVDGSELIKHGADTRLIEYSEYTFFDFEVTFVKEI